MALIRIKNLTLRTIIGINDWEREKKQDVIINIELEYDSAEAAAHDTIDYSIDYKTIAKEIIKEVEQAHFFLLEALADFILKMIMSNTKVQRAAVEVDKPYALRFAESVSVVVSAKREI